ncbi:MAG: hypothetical protein FWE80_10010, partial [Oscillospiraceae bacterium]|nr:hypothetical protein [Oscillospiraceae bacterium]
MIALIRKKIFGNGGKTQAAPHIFLILCAYTVITTVYTLAFYGIEMMLVRFLLDIAIIAIHVAAERSRISARAAAFLSPTLMAVVLVFGAVFFGGDSLLFIYLSCIAMVSLTYFSTKGLAVHILTVTAGMSVVLFVFGINLLGKDFTMLYNVISFIASLGLNALVYTFCTFCVKTLKALTEAENQAIHAARAKGDFLANMSHEIRAPMNAIIGMTAIGMSAGDAGRKDYCFAKIDDASKHLLGVINDILDMSKIEAGKF